MKTGIDNKRNVTILIVLGVVMLVCVIYFVKAVFVGGSPAAPVATAPAPQPGVRNASRAGGGREAPKAVKLENLDPTLHPELMAGAESLVYSGSGRNIFSMASAPPKIEKVEAQIRPGPVTPPAPTGPPPPPAIDLKFFGYEAEGGAKKAFILHGDDVFIASEGDVVDHHFRILKINPLSIQVTDLLYNNTQTLPLTQS